MAPRRINTSRKRQRLEPKSVPKLCSVCETESPPYKCPSCNEALYCSVACCRKHKLICPGKPSTTPTTSRYLEQEHIQKLESQLGTSSVSLPVDCFQPDCCLTDDMKAALVQCEWLKEELEDRGLQLLVRKAIKDGDPSCVHKSFLDKLLAIAGVLERDDDSTQSLSDWLRGPIPLTDRLRFKDDCQRYNQESDADCATSSSGASSSSSNSSEDE